MPDRPSLTVELGSDGEWNVKANYRDRALLLGMLEEAKWLILTGRKSESPTILPSNGNPMTDWLLKARSWVNSPS